MLIDFSQGTLYLVAGLESKTCYSVFLPTAHFTINVPYTTVSVIDTWIAKYESYSGVSPSILSSLVLLTLHN